MCLAASDSHHGLVVRVEVRVVVDDQFGGGEGGGKLCMCCFVSYLSVGVA